jgi:hypothetical protein
MEDAIIDAAKDILPIVGAAAKPVIKKGVEKMLKRADGIDSNVSDAFTVQGREMTILCPESIQKYSLSLTAKPTGFFNKKAKFELGKVRRVNIRSIIGLQSIDAITPLDNGFELNLKKLKPGEQYVLDVEYFLEEQNFLDSLVNREVVNETPEGDSTKYWMVAQLKHLESLKTNFCRIDLRDVDFNVNVGVHQDVSTKIPGAFKDQLETIAELTKRKGRSEKFKLFQKLLHIQNTKFGGKEYELLGDVMSLFSPPNFRKYVNVEKDFHYSTCEKGTSVYDFPIVTWPKFMKVTSRTDLGLDKPASNGQLIYKRGDFMTELEQIFGSSKK